MYGSNDRGAGESFVQADAGAVLFRGVGFWNIKGRGG